jgi:hypothetical protein
MATIAVNISREGRSWRIAFAVDGKVEPRHVFGCSDGMLPLIAGLMAAEAQAHAISSHAKSQMSTLPTTIAVGMPSGRTLTFSLTSLQEAYTLSPESFP